MGARGCDEAGVRRVDFGTHGAAFNAIRRTPERLRYFGDDRRRALYVWTQGAFGGLADWHACERRRRNRYYTACLRTVAEGKSAARSAVPAGALHGDQ